jgi:hypothetical protein
MSPREAVLLPAFAGVFFALAVLGPEREGPSGSAWLARAPDPLVAERVLDPDRMCVRDLRRLPTIGAARALSIVRARFDHGLDGGPGAWTSIDGIGPETVRAARTWIEAARAARVSAGLSGAYTSGAAGHGSATSADDPGSSAEGSGTSVERSGTSVEDSGTR